SVSRDWSSDVCSSDLGRGAWQKGKNGQNVRFQVVGQSDGRDRFSAGGHLPHDRGGKCAPTLWKRRENHFHSMRKGVYRSGLQGNGTQRHPFLPTSCYRALGTDLVSGTKCPFLMSA